MDNKNYVESWYVDYRHEVYKYIISLVNDLNLAEDLMQDTFEKAYIKANTFQEKSSVKTWLFRIAYNVSIDFFRKQKSQQKCKNSYIAEKSLNENNWDLYQREDNKELIDILNNLKDSYKNVIILRKLHGYSVKETGELLNWPESKVKVTLSRAIRYLKRQLIMSKYNQKCY